MKKYLALATVIFFVIFSNAQKGFGFDVGIGTSKAPMIAAKYYLDKNAFSIGASYQIFNDALGKKKNLVLGDTAIGDGDYFYSIDIGYTRVFNEKFSVTGEVSIGGKKYYQNVRDDSAPSGGYYRILDSKAIVGVGVIGTYWANDVFGFFAGYNTIREACAGVQLKFVH